MAYRVIFLIYAALGMVKLGLTFALTSAVEAEQMAKPQYQQVAALELEQGLLSDTDDEDEPQELAQPTPPAKRSFSAPQWHLLLLSRLWSLLPHISPSSRQMLWRLLLLFALDAFGGGMASSSWLTYFFTAVHSLQPATLGTLFLVTISLPPSLTFSRCRLRAAWVHSRRWCSRTSHRLYSSLWSPSRLRRLGAPGPPCPSWR